ncbi:MAG: EutN/CcmL family microcompartment protein [Cyanobacteriota bacterium]
MYLGKVIGTVVTTQKDPCLEGKKLLLVVTLDGENNEIGEPIVAVDTVQAGIGDHVFMVTSREACLALPGPLNIIDAAITGIVDSVE